MSSDQLEHSPGSDEGHEMGESQEMEDLSEEQIVATILDLGNQIWANMGFDEPIQDPSVFFRDQFYMQFFMSAFPDNDFSDLVETEDEQEMAYNIQKLINMLSESILMYDLEHIKGDQIVQGNSEHCINLLQLAKEISCMMNSNSNELDPNQLQEEQSDSQEGSPGQQQYQMEDDDDHHQASDLFAMQQQLQLENQEGKHSSDDQSNEQEDQHDASQGVVDYDQIQVELEEDEEEVDDDHHRRQLGDDDNDDGENEVSINLEDAIATAEEINKQNSMDPQMRFEGHQDGQDSSDDDDDGQKYAQVDGELVSAEEIAGIVTDGHNEKDGFDQMREEQLQRQRMVRQSEEYGDEESGLYDEEDDMNDQNQQYALNSQGMMQQQDQEEDEDDDEGEGMDDGDMQQIHPDLIAAAHKLGVDLDNAQIQELQKFIEQQDIDLNAEESEAEIDENQQQDGQSQSDSSSGKKKHKKSSSSSSSQKSEKEQQSMEDEQAYEYLQQEEQQYDDHQNQDNDDGEDEEDQGEDGDDENDKLQFDVDELNEQERQLLVAYLQEEYEKNPDTFQIPKEKLQELINAQLSQQNNQEMQEDDDDDGEDGDNQDDDENQEDQEELTEEQQQQLLMMQAVQQQQQMNQDGEVMDEESQPENGELEIEGGGQQIEEDDFPTEQELIDQQLTQEQIQQVLLLKNQMAMQQQPNGQNMVPEGAEEDEQDDQQHQMQHIYVHRQQQQRKRKGTKGAVTGGTAAQSKYSQARSKKTVSNSNKQMMSNTAESNMQDHNPLHRLMQAPPKSGRPPVRPSTGKRQPTKAQITTQRPQTAKPRQPAQSYKQFIASQSNRAGRTSHRNNTQSVQSQSMQQMKPLLRKQSAKKRNTAKKHQLNTISHMPETNDQNALLLQQLIAQKQESGVMPMFNEEFLSQLSEEQLQQVIQQQQAVIQQNPPMSSKSTSSLPPRPRRARSAKRPQSSHVLSEKQQIQARQRHQIYHQPVPAIGSGRRRTSKPSSANREKKASKGKRRKVQPGQGILLNNFFPALESGGHHSGQKPTAEDHFAAQQAAALLAQQQEAQQQQEQIINEVPPEEEEGESQDIMNSRIQQTSSVQQQEQAQLQEQTMQLVQALEQMDPAQQQEFLEQLTPEQQEQLLIHQQQMQMQQEAAEGQEQEEEVDQQMYAVDENGQPVMQQEEQEDPNNPEVDVELTEGQLVELLKNADQLTIEQQTQLQQILKNRWKKEIKTQKQKQYNNIYNILTENVAKAKVRLSKLAESPNKRTASQQDEDKATMERIARQKKEYETLLRQYQHEQKARHKGREQEQKRIERQLAREMKLKQIREKKFEEELINQQKSLMYKRNAQQVRLCQKVYQLASNLEKNKLLEEKRHYQENQSLKKTQKQMMVDGIENFYKDKINMLRERIETEKFERKIAQNAQVEALSRMKRELDLSKKKEIQKYLQLLSQEDQKYDFQSSNLNKLESEIVRLYKK